MDYDLEGLIMKTVSKICFLSMATLLAACNEQISPELQKAGAGSGTTDSSGLIVPDEYYFKLTNTSSVIRNFKLHKTGNNSLLNDKCQITSASKLSVFNFQSQPASYDITCYFEAEELSLRFGGFSWEVEASPNTCEFIRYNPFSYYNRMPGKSFGTYNKTTCVGTINPAEIAAGYPSCGNTVNSTAFRGMAAANNQFSLSSEAELCRFNYTDNGGEKCDDGSVTISEIVVTEVFDADGLRQTPTTTTLLRTINCGGKAANCISGPIKNHSELTATKGSILTPANFDEVTKYSVSYPSLYPSGPDNYHYANFRRDLAHTNINFANSSHDYLVAGGKKSVNFSGTGDLSDGTTDYLAAYLNAWTGLSTTDIKAFSANEVERYSRNLLRNANTKNLDTTFDYTKTSSDPNDYTVLENSSILENRYTARPYAFEPFVGLANGYETNPVYTFSCLDNTFEVKARIRVFVRDWDKVLPSDATLEYVTDINRSEAKQDAQREIESVGSNDESNDYNDVLDWDDIISITRSASQFIPFASTVTYPDGYFERKYFPNYIKP